MFNERVKQVFSAYSKEDTVYFTSDGQAFFGAHFADAQAQTLKDKTITTITREHAFAEDSEQADAEKAAADAQAKADAEKAAADAQAKADAEKAAADAQAQIDADNKALADAQAKVDADKQKSK